MANITRNENLGGDMFGRSGSSLLRSLFDDAPMFIRPIFGSQGAIDLKMDLAENDNAYRLSVDLPGVRKEDIQVKVYENQLTISAESKEEKELGKDDQNWLVRERMSGKLTRTIALPEAVDENGAEARHEYGVLYLTLPKRQSTSSKQITIQ